MDSTQKQSLLTQLAQTEGDAAQAAILKEANKIATALTDETRYDAIENQITLLNAIAWRVPEKAFDITHALLTQLSATELTYEPIVGFSIDEIRKLNHKNSLVIKAMGILGAICFHDPKLDEKILKIFLDASIHTERIIRKEANNKLAAIAGYRIDIWNAQIQDGSFLGATPQLNIVEFINKLNNAERKKYLIGITTICDALLSPTIDGSTFTYNKAIFQQGAIPATDAIKKIRHDVLSLLESMYALAETINAKMLLINIMQAATRTPHQARYGDDVMVMIFADTKAVLEIYSRILSIESDLQIIQHIEHTAYWDYKRANYEDVKEAALKIRDIIAENNEYQIFKVLIGFEGVFNEWRTISASKDEEDKAITNEIEQAQKIRDKRVVELAEGVTAEKFGEWKTRILQYAQIQSDDAATFPSFAKFLELMGKKSPDFALILLEGYAEELERFIPFLLWSAYESSQRQRAEILIRTWVEAGGYLRPIVGMFGGIKNWDVILFKAVCTKAIEKNDIPALKQIISVIVGDYNSGRKDFVNTILADSIRKLTASEDCGGVLNIWFRKEIRTLVQDMDSDTVNAVLENLIFAKEIGYEAEAILVAIARQYPDKIVEFFGTRLKKEDHDQRGSGYSAIPYQFHELQKPLSTIPEKLVDAVSQWFDGGYGVFIYRGGRFLKNIFPDFPEQFQNKLIDLIKTGEKDKQLIVLAILRNYDGNPRTHGVCKELVKVFSANSAELNEVGLVLQNTGVVQGEYGFVEAYQRKKEEMTPWLTDDNEKVRAFAQQQITRLDSLMDWSKKRADEDIELRKFKYGTEEDSL